MLKRAAAQNPKNAPMKERLTGPNSGVRAQKDAPPREELGKDRTQAWSAAREGFAASDALAGEGGAHSKWSGGWKFEQIALKKRSETELRWEFVADTNRFSQIVHHPNRAFSLVLRVAHLPDDAATLQVVAPYDGAEVRCARRDRCCSATPSSRSTLPRGPFRRCRAPRDAMTPILAAWPAPAAIYFHIHPGDMLRSVAIPGTPSPPR